MVDLGFVLVTGAHVFWCGLCACFRLKRPQYRTREWRRVMCGCAVVAAVLVVVSTTSSSSSSSSPGREEEGGCAKDSSTTDIMSDIGFFFGITSAILAWGYKNRELMAEDGNIQEAARVARARENDPSYGKCCPCCWGTGAERVVPQARGTKRAATAASLDDDDDAKAPARTRAKRGGGGGGGGGAAAAASGGSSSRSTRSKPAGTGRHGASGSPLS